MANLSVYKGLLRYKDSQGNWHDFDAISGRDGTTPQISAAVTALAAGQSPTVTVGGTTEAPVFTFGIPRGDTGQKGDKGDSGTNGRDGATQNLLFQANIPRSSWTLQTDGTYRNVVSGIAAVPDARDTSANPQLYVLTARDIAIVALDTATILSYTGATVDMLKTYRDQYSKIVRVETTGDSTITVYSTASSLSVAVPILLRVLR